jgi:hypothetical protein
MINFIIKVARFNKFCISAAIVAATFLGYTDHARAVRDMMIFGLIEAVASWLNHALNSKHK